MGKTVTKIKRFVSLLVAYVMLISVVPSVFANPAEKFSDFPTGWSKPAMESAVENGLLVGIGDGQIGPKKNLTRAEMAAVMVRAFGATTVADISMFKDLDPNAWYYNDIAKAVRMGALSGVSATEMAPEDYITREQVFSILSRILALSSDNKQALSKFDDADEVSAWALSTVIPLVERGYVKGDGLGNLNPKSYITREEFAQLMYSTIRRYITKPGTYEEDMEGIVVVRCGNVTIKDANINGDFVVGDGAGKDAVNFDGVTIGGRLLTRGGTNTLKATEVKDGVVVLNPNGTTFFKNYRTEEPFKGIIEHTIAAFLTPGGTSGGPTGGTTKHDVVFKLFETDDDAYAEIKVYDGKKIGNKMPDDPEVSGYTFNGWVDGNGDPVTADTRVYDDMVVVADLTLIPAPTTYIVTFKLFDTDTVAYATADVVSGQPIGTQMPADPDPADIPGYTFNGWVDENGDPVTDATVVTAGMTVVADLTPIVTPPTTYTVTFKLFASDTTAYAEFEVEDGQAIGTNMPADPDPAQIPGYTFNGWVDENGDPVTDTTVVTAGMTVVADLTPIVTPPTTYTVTFKLFASDTTAYAEFEVEDGQAIGAQMPADPDPAQIPGYTFNGWVDGNGDPVTDATVVTAGMTVVADLTPIVTPPTTYTVTFKLFASDTTAYAEFDVEDGQAIGTNMPADPMASQISGYTFNGWVDENGDPVTDATIVTGAMTVIADLTPITTPPETITVEFYEGYGRFAPQIGSTLTLELDTNGEAKVDVSDIPANIYTWRAYTKSEYMETGYADYDGTVDVKPQFMYYKGGEWLPFDETVVLTEDTTVHMFYKYIGLSGFETEVSTRYTDATRVIDSLISLSDNATVQLDAAKNTGLDIYEKIDEIIYGTLEDKNLIDADRRIKKITIPLPINAALTESLIKDVIEERLSHLLDTPELYDKLFMWPEVEEYLIANGPTIPAGLTQAQIRELIKTYIDGLTPSETDALVDELCEVIYNTDEYDEVVDAVLNNKTLVVDIDNIKIVKEIQKELETITFDTVMSLSHDSFFDKIVDIAGYSVCADIFNKGREKYCEELEKVVYDVENGILASEAIETEFSLLFDPIEDILLPIYEKAKLKAIDKLSALNVRYDENPYLQYLVEHDVIDRLFVDTGVVTEKYSSYAIKDITDYTAYMVELEIAVNDSLLWYGEELTETEFNAVYDAVFAKMYAASDKLDEIMNSFVEDGELPSKVETAITSVKKINDLFLKFEPKLKKLIVKYLNSKIHDNIANGNLDENERIQHAIDILVGQDDPIFTIDSLFDIFYNYDDKVQAKLQTLLASEKFDKAMAKFEASPIGKKLSDNAINEIVEILENVAEYGVEYYQVDTSSDITVVEQYKLEIDGKEIILVRRYEF